MSPTDHDLAGGEVQTVPTDQLTYEILWFTINGGSQTFITGGRFNSAGTSGQPDVGFLSGGNFTLAGGFWRGVPDIYVDMDEQPEDPALNLPKVFRLFPNYPNPFNPITHIAFDLPYACLVQLELYPLQGRSVRKFAERATTSMIEMETKKSQ